MQKDSEQLLRSNLLSISAKQIERVTNAYGALSEVYDSESQETNLHSPYPLSESDAASYCMLDGSMILTRESFWKEVKLCRFFSQKDRLNPTIKGRKTAQKRRSLLTYFENNKDRMCYKIYQEKGYLIGSGAIESAHRTVVQARMKRSGQRWSIKRGAKYLKSKSIE